MGTQVLKQISRTENILLLLRRALHLPLFLLSRDLLGKEGMGWRALNVEGVWITYTISSSPDAS